MKPQDFRPRGNCVSFGDSYFFFVFLPSLKPSSDAHLTFFLGSLLLRPTGVLQTNELELVWRVLELLVGKPLAIVNRYKLLPSASRVWCKGIPDILTTKNTILFETSYVPSHSADGPQPEILMIN